MPGHTTTVAIVDDDEAYRLALSRLLTAKGHRVKAFSSGADFLAAASRASLDCVLLDLFMAGMTGFDVLAELRRSPASPPVIVVTAHDDPVLIGRAAALCAFECHTKPVGAATLLDAIERAMGRRSRP